MRLFRAKLSRIAKRISGMPGRLALAAEPKSDSKKPGAGAVWARRVGILK
jgi:hypothetical protein